MHRARLLTATLALLVVLLAPAPDVRPATAPGTPPSIVFILTDDQRWDTLWAMPTLQRRLAAHGVTFANAFVSNPLCCPSRATILTGTYSHTNGVYGNAPPSGGFPKFQDASTIATWLHRVGYQTALVGKYLNRYTDAQAAYVPPGWDRWVAFTGRNGDGGYYGFTVSVDGSNRTFGQSVYSTDWLAGQAASFIRSADPARPLFLEFAPKAPHYPYAAATRHRNSFADLPPWRPPSWNELDVSDKPAYIRALPRSTDRYWDRTRRQQYQTLLAVDEAIATILDALSAEGRLHTTMIVFASDNGVLWGEHRWHTKWVPYEESVRIPLVVRYDPLTTSARTDDRLVTNLDLAPTFAALAGSSAPGAEGASLLPLLADGPVPWRTDFLLEHLYTGDRPVPTYCGVRDRRYAYYEYRTTEEELYDLRVDPYQLDNRAGDPAFAPIRDRLHSRLVELCDPPPDGLIP